MICSTRPHRKQHSTLGHCRKWPGFQAGLTLQYSCCCQTFCQASYRHLADISWQIGDCVSFPHTEDMTRPTFRKDSTDTRYGAQQSAKVAMTTAPSFATASTCIYTLCAHAHSARFASAFNSSFIVRGAAGSEICIEVARLLRHIRVTLAPSCGCCRHLPRRCAKNAGATYRLICL